MHSLKSGKMDLWTASKHIQSLPQLQTVFHVLSSSVVTVKDKLGVIEMVCWVSGEGNVKNYCKQLVGVGDIFGPRFR